MVEIHFDNVSQNFEGREVLRRLSITFHSGMVTAIAGANGSGKSTLLRLVARLLIPTSGTVDTVRDGTPVKGAAYRSMLAMATPEMELYTRLTVRENLALFLGTSGVPCGEPQLQELLVRVGLPPAVLPRMVGQLSTGMRQRVRIAVLLGVDAPIWLLDEPGLALDERGQALLQHEVRSAAERGRLILWATNDRAEREAADVCVSL